MCLKPAQAKADRAVVPQRSLPDVPLPGPEPEDGAEVADEPKLELVADPADAAEAEEAEEEEEEEEDFYEDEEDWE